MRINKVVETCIYSSDLDGMKKFYVGILGLPLVQEEEGNSFSFRPARACS
jgi:catechol 2,3-dioxygenase-like lactoylglutathione lyase family enzyme